MGARAKRKTAGEFVIHVFNEFGSISEFQRSHAVILVV